MSGEGQRPMASISDEVLRFRAGFRSVVIATANAAGVPEASYAPYVTGGDGHFFICVSALARHTRNLEQTGKADLLFIQDETAAANLFARMRLSYACRAVPVGRDTEVWAEVMGRFEEDFGGITAVLRTLADFHVFRLMPLSGRYVRGFGQAYVLEGPSLSEVRPLRPGPPGANG